MKRVVFFITFCIALGLIAEGDVTGKQLVGYFLLGMLMEIALNKLNI